jgi:hypothetical protein
MKPVFIGGCGRSGTTLLGAMLGAHSDCLCTPETSFFIEVYRTLCNRGERGVDIGEAWKRIARHWRFKVWGVDYRPLPAGAQGGGDSYPSLMKRIVTLYGEKVGQRSASLWIDHTPENVKYAETLRGLFPDMKMIHIVRDGRGVASSIMPLDWGPNTTWTAAHWWAESVSYGVAVESLYGKKRVMRVRYEDLVTESERTLLEICSFLDIEYQPVMLDASGFTVPEYTSRQHSLVGKRPDIKRVNAWERELTPREIEIFENITGDLLCYFGYAPRYGLKAKGITDREKLALMIREVSHYIVHRIRLHSRMGSMK